MNGAAAARLFLSIFDLRLRVEGWIRVVANALFPESSKGHAWSRGWLPNVYSCTALRRKKKRKKSSRTFPRRSGW